MNFGLNRGAFVWHFVPVVLFLLVGMAVSGCVKEYENLAALRLPEEQTASYALPLAYDSIKAQDLLVFGQKKMKNHDTVFVYNAQDPYMNAKDTAYFDYRLGSELDSGLRNDQDIVMVFERELAPVTFTGARDKLKTIVKSTSISYDQPKFIPVSQDLNFTFFNDTEVFEEFYAPESDLYLQLKLSVPDSVFTEDDYNNEKKIYKSKDLEKYHLFLAFKELDIIQNTGDGSGGSSLGSVELLTGNGSNINKTFIDGQDYYCVELRYRGDGRFGVTLGNKEIPDLHEKYLKSNTGHFFNITNPMIGISFDAGAPIKYLASQSALVEFGLRVPLLGRFKMKERKEKLSLGDVFTKQNKKEGEKKKSVEPQSVSLHFVFNNSLPIEMKVTEVQFLTSSGDICLQSGNEGFTFDEVKYDSSDAKSPLTKSDNGILSFDTEPDKVPVMAIPSPEAKTTTQSSMPSGISYKEVQNETPTERKHYILTITADQYEKLKNATHVQLTLKGSSYNFDEKDNVRILSFNRLGLRLAMDATVRYNLQF